MEEDKDIDISIKKEGRESCRQAKQQACLHCPNRYAIKYLCANASSVAGSTVAILPSSFTS